MSTRRYRTGRWVIWSLVALLAILHQDFWWWDDRTLVFGFMPIGLGYHAAFSIMAACVWAAALHFAWPEEIEAWAEVEDSQAKG